MAGPLNPETSVPDKYWKLNAQNKGRNSLEQNIQERIVQGTESSGMQLHRKALDSANHA
jgi:hypothetical protein